MESITAPMAIAQHILEPWQHAKPLIQPQAQTNPKSVGK